jgi:hypothetical protein
MTIPESAIQEWGLRERATATADSGACRSPSPLASARRNTRP